MSPRVTASTSPQADGGRRRGSQGRTALREQAVDTSAPAVRPAPGSLPASPPRPYLAPGWTLLDHLADLDPDLLALARTPDGSAWALTASGAEARRLLTLDDPLLFAWVYLHKHLRGPETGDEVSFSRFHLDVFADARTWLVPAARPAEHRTAYVAPRGAGKSTLAFLCVPMWAAAHLVVDFVAAFADSATQAELHLTTFKRELDTNELLRHDFPLLARPARRPGGTSVSDNRGLMLAANGFVFAAKGIDSSSLGMKVGERRPRVLLMDDIEPDESNYSAGQKDKRLSTIRDAVFPLNLNARVLMVGTTTMHGSVMHDVVRQATDPGHCPPWVAEESIRTRYYPAIVTAPDGTEESLWPERWSLEYLHSIRHTRSYQKNYANRPVSLDGGFWTAEHFRYDPPALVTRRILSIDPAVTSRASSDPTGLAIVGYDPTAGHAVVEYAAAVRLTPAALRAHILMLLGRHPVHGVVVEVNQGGDAWAEILSPLPVKIATVHQHEPKAVRASRALDWYQSGWVAHADRDCARAFEEQATAFPGGVHDDVLDAVVTGLNVFLAERKRTPRRRESNVQYA